MTAACDRQRLGAIAVGVCVASLHSLAGPRLCHATLLDSPPREQTFSLDGPTVPRYELLRGFREADVERLGPRELYLRSPWGKWWRQPMFMLSWWAAAPSGDLRSEASTPPLSADLSWWVTERTAARTIDHPIVRWVDDATALPSLDLTENPRHAYGLARASSSRWLTRLDKGFITPDFAWTGVGFDSNGFDLVWSMPPLKPIVDWRCRRRPVQFVRFEGEHDSFPLVRCDGTVQPEAIDRLSILARPNGVERPSELLPDDVDPQAWELRREWIQNVKVFHPRMLWVLQMLADAFPYKTFYIFSGYRRPDDQDGSLGTHDSRHAHGRALDLMVYGVPNEQVFKICRTLRDVGCGFYPNAPFVHVDLRPPHSGKAIWIDISAPGEPSEYVDAWPGVVDSGGMVWVKSPGDDR